MGKLPGYSSAVALVTAAGSGTRMGGGVKKEYRIVDGMPVLVHAALAFARTGRFARIIITLPEHDLETAPRLLGSWIDPSYVVFVAGGPTRQNSVYRGLLAASRLFGTPREACVLIHDGARPWISPELIARVLDGTFEYGACLPVLPAVYAMKTIDGSGFVEKHLDRSNLVSAQTPQGFEFSGILNAHERAIAEGYEGYDDTELYGRYEGPVFTVPGDPDNIKITYGRDLEAAR